MVCRDVQRGGEEGGEALARQLLCTSRIGEMVEQGG